MNWLALFLYASGFICVSVLSKMNRNPEPDAPEASDMLLGLLWPLIPLVALVLYVPKFIVATWKRSKL